MNDCANLIGETEMSGTSAPLRYCTKCRRVINPSRVARNGFYCGDKCRDLDKRQRRQWKVNRYCRLCGKPKTGDPVKDQR